MEPEIERSESGEQILIRLSHDEFFLLSGSLNEAIEGIKDWEFSVRLGADKAAARRLRSQFRDVIARLRTAESTADSTPTPACNGCAPATTTPPPRSSSPSTPSRRPPAILGGALGDISAYAWQNTDNGTESSSCNDADSESPAISEANAGHIFRDSTGHMAKDTVANRALLRDSVRPENEVGSYNGIDTYTQLQSDGSQVWAEVRNGEITNGGVNRTPYIHGTKRSGNCDGENSGVTVSSQEYGENASVLSARQAYIAMYRFLEDYQRRGGSDDIFLLLHAMRLTGDDETTDPGSWSDWIRAIDATNHGET